MPRHRHQYTRGYGPDTVQGFIGEIAALNAAPTDADTNFKGQDEPHENLPPYFVINWFVVAKP
jgi:hypothetical protein